jgi:4-hydroxy-tetrahydrodipicolinate reductase
MIKVAVAGVTGRMGAETCRAIEAASDLALVAAVSRSAAGKPLASVVAGIRADLVVSGDLEAVAAAGAQVLVEFTSAPFALEALEWAARAGVHVVSGTTGISPEAFARLAGAFGKPGGPNALWAANFAISAVLLLRFAELAAPHFEGIEIVELHHGQKRDAPSGTALETARRIARAREAAGSGPLLADPTEEEVIAGARGGAGPGGVRVHAVRLPGLVAHEEVLFGSLGQSLTIRQDTYDRRSFMPGVLLAVRKVATTPGLTVGLEPLLGL